MNTLLALTIEIPDWLFNGEFWSGFLTAIGIVSALMLCALSKFNPFG